jgi:Cu/Ag efflux pump CusA
VHGQDLDTLDHDAKKIAGVLSGIKGASEIQIQSPPGTPELAIRLRPERLAAFGLQSLDVLENIQANRGKIRLEVGKRLKNLRKIPDLVFHIDDSLDYALKIDELLKK